jgi:ethanolamine utilization protein EutA
MSHSQFLLTSVGIDIGSTTSHFVISRLTLRPATSDPDSKLEVKKREVLYLSEIIFTPFRGADEIDGEEIARFVKAGYAKIGLEVGAVDVGAIIVTGVAARKQNAERVASSISGLAGDFVCVTAGPRLEAILSAFGSGAIALSAEHHDHGHDHEHDEPHHDHRESSHQHEQDSEGNPHLGTVMNIDVGGGTTKIAIVSKGRIIETSALNIGARLVKWDDWGLITGIEPTAERIARARGIKLELGQVAASASLDLVADQLVSSLFEFISFMSSGGSLSKLTRDLLITGLPAGGQTIDSIVFSGGVSEYIYGQDATERGDMGVLLGRLIARRFQSKGFQFHVGRPSQFIRATVIGASHYTCQISGNTIFLSDPGDLPVKNALMIPVDMPDNLHLLDEKAIAEKFLTALEPYDEKELTAFFVNTSMLGHDGVRALSAGIVRALSQRVSAGQPLILVFNANIGRQVGVALRDRLEQKSSVLCVDEIQPEGMAYIDIGKPVEQSGPVPVVIKSLIFDDTRLNL